MKIAVLVGSLRKESYNLKTAKAVMALAPKALEMEILEIGDLPLYNEDAETDSPPASWSRFRNQLKPFDGVLFFTPEYNRSVPAVLKNAIDVGSRPYGKSVWAGKAGGVVSVSVGAQGAFGANHALRQSLVFLDVPAMQQPEVYLGNAGDLFDERGNFKNEKTKAFLQKFIDAYAKWVGTVRGISL
jgi:chromate reductase